MATHSELRGRHTYMLNAKHTGKSFEKHPGDVVDTRKAYAKLYIHLDHRLVRQLWLTILLLLFPSGRCPTSLLPSTWPHKPA